MQFNSLWFIPFFAVVYFANWHVKERLRQIILLSASLIFYCINGKEYMILFLFLILSSFLFGMAIERNTRKKKLLYFLAISVLIGMLLFFKYYRSFFPDNSVLTRWIMPIGFSFYTFQIIAYLTDLYRGGGRAERDIVSYSLFISYFPYVCSGPISRANQILPQIKTLPKYSSECFDRGIKEILCGYFKKLVVADTIAVYVNNVFSNINEFTGFALLLAAFLFSIQIYCDFSGYTDMAIGYSRLLGIELSVNFKTPYFSSSITEFWRRWHISLSSWFRDYVYIPLGGNRKGRFRQYCNLLITFMVSGIWHGDSLTFIVWGGIHGALQIIEKQFMGSVAVKKENKIQKLINTIIVFILVTCAWVFFKANTISDAFYVFQNMFDGISNLSSYITIGFHEIGITRKVLLVIIMNLFILFIVDLSEFKGTKENAQNSILSYSFYSLLLVVIILFSPKGVASQFVYFQF